VTTLIAIIRSLSSAKKRVVTFFTADWDTDDTQLLSQAEGLSDAFRHGQR
jgi:hypothetical protein